MTDRYGTFEHADHATPRPEHGYCVDDMARLLLVTSRDARAVAAGGRAGPAVSPLPRRRPGADRSNPEPALGRRPVARTSRRRRLLGPEPLGPRHGVVLPRLPGGQRSDVLRPRRPSSDLAGRGRWPSRRSARPPSSTPTPAPRRARALLQDAAELLIGLGSDAPSGWAWPEPRLSYANAALPDALLAAGHTLEPSRAGRPRARAAGVAPRSGDHRRATCRSPPSAGRAHPTPPPASTSSPSRWRPSPTRAPGRRA